MMSAAMSRTERVSFAETIETSCSFTLSSEACLYVCEVSHHLIIDEAGPPHGHRDVF